MFTARWKMRQVALAAALATAPLLAQADSTTTLPDYPLEVCTTSVDPTQSGSAAAVTNSNIVQGDSTLFASYYNYSEMTGDLKAFTIDPTTGTVSSTPQWTNSGTPVGAQGKLDAISNLSTGRKLYTNITGRVELEAGNGSNAYCGDATRRLYLNALTQSACQDIINTLKGDTTITGYRHPAHRLGTIVHSEPIYVSGLQRVIQAANDGMVHAFKHDNSAVGANNSSNGEEAWAYVPTAFLGGTIGQLEAPDIDTFTSTAYTTHKYWLDATPSVENFSSTTYYFASAYGKGAKGIFSLTLAADQPTPLWTFDTTTAATSTDTTTDADTYIGYIYGRPIITQVTIGTTLTKVAIFAGGFSNTDLGNSSITGTISSYSYLYVINLSTGALIKKFKVTGKGLNYIAGFADSYSTLNQIKYVYGGDLDGNVWRFDLTATTASSWSVYKLASLSAPITSEPELAEITINGTLKRFVYVGTGRYLTTSDISSGETGSMVGLIDRVDDSGYTDASATTPSQLSTVTLASSSYATSADTNTGTASNISTHGWKAQLPSGQRVINSPALANGKVLFTANQPADPCTSGMESWLYVIDYQTGLQTGYFSLASTASSAGLSDTHFLSSRPTVIKLSSGAYRAMIRTTDGETLNVDLGTLLSTSSGGSGTVKGIFWREVITQ